MQSHTTGSLVLFGLAATTTFGCGAPTREEAVEQRLRHTLDALALHDWPAAEQQLDTVERLDPWNAEAKQLGRLMEEARRQQEAQAVFLHVEEDRPWNLGGRVVPRRARAHARLHASLLEPDADDLGRVVASRKMTLSFVDTPLPDVASFLSDVTGLDFTVGPWIDASGTRVSMRVKGIALGDVLGLIADQTRLLVTVRQGRVVFDNTW